MMKGMSLFPVISILFIIWGNSDYSPAIKKVGFYCNDTTIKKPYHGDSIHAGSLFLCLLSGAAVIVYVSEKMCRDNQSSDFEFKHYLKYFYSGFLYVLTFTEILKLSCRELRPHFFFTCQPDVDQVKCSNGFVTEFNCMGDGPKWLVDRDIYKSFPSGHASLSVYTFVFLSIYIHRRLLQIRSNFCTIWKIIIPPIFLTYAVICCVSRLLDHRHFWWDVLVGVIIGLIGGLIMANASSKHMKSRQEQKVS